MGKKIRVDQLLYELGLAESRSQAQRMVMAGQVRADDQLIPKPSTKVTRDTVLTVHQRSLYVSRGGDKLAAAFEAFNLDVNGSICADVGASTGGFTDCLLQRGASKVYAIDVGQGILHWKLRNDPRVVVMEEVNARYVKNLPEPIHFVTIDASFISLKMLLPVVKNWLEPDPNLEKRGDVLGLVKPQFEAGRKEAARGRGVIRAPAIHQEVLVDVLSYAASIGYAIRGLERSPVIGPKGNVEFLMWLQSFMDAEVDQNEIMTFVSQVVDVEKKGEEIDDHSFEDASPNT
jgi:23S rRNA (cytidine1920-2'-O)/16S rRNA (cytidine1409-2'-O)-methyltransferase